MSAVLKYTFLTFAILTTLFGIPLLLAPGKLLDFFGWAPVEPLLDRMLGAALIGLAWGSLRAFQRGVWEEAHLLLQVNALFCALAAIGLMRHLLVANYPGMVWFVTGLYVGFAALFVFLWVKGKRA